MPRNSSGNLVAQVAEALGPDGVWQALRPFIPSLPQPRNDRVEVRALCPSHNDHRPSWCWNLARGIATCHVCGEGNVSFVSFIARQTNQRPVTVLDGFCRQLGLPRPRKRILTLQDYATAKAVPAEFLAAEFQMSDDEDGLYIPYLDSSGRLLAQRRRRYLAVRPKWAQKGVVAKGMVYGLHGLGWISPTGRVLIVEGESDLHTAWFHNLPALATPGANVGHEAMAKAVRAAEAHTAYVIPDSDLSGRTMLAKMERAFSRIGWVGELLAARLPAKDLSDLHLECGQEFDQAFNASLFRAEPVSTVLARFDTEAAVEDVKMTKTMRAVLPSRTLNPADKVIVLTVADQVGCDPSRPMPVSRSKLARLAGMPRRTLYDRLPGIVAAGLLRDENGRLYLGQDAVR